MSLSGSWEKEPSPATRQLYTEALTLPEPAKAELDRGISVLVVMPANGHRGLRWEDGWVFSEEGSRQ